MGNDQNVGPLLLAEPFWFYGTTHTTLRVCSNGWISFSATGNAFPVNLPDPSFPYLIAPFATDLVPTPSGDPAVYWGTHEGKVVIQWVQVPHLVNPNGTFDFEIVLDPSDSSITFQYLHAEGITWNTVTRVVGIQDGTGTHYLVYSSSSHFRPLQDSFAIRFYFYPYPDLQGIEVLNPNDSELLLPSVSILPQALFWNAGPMSATVSFVCAIDSAGTEIYADTLPSVSIAAGDSAVLTFRSWTPVEQVDYRIQVYPISPGDPEPVNDTLRRRARIPFSPDSSLSYAQGDIGAAWGQQDEAFWALSFEVPETVILSYIRVHLIGEGDPLGPYPDESRDPIILGVWEGTASGTPGMLLYADTLLRDTVPPGWVYSVPPGTLVIPGGRFFVGVSTWIRGYGVEALALDEALDYPDAQWRYYPGGSWQQGVWASEGDPWIEVYYTRGPTEIRESQKPASITPIRLKIQGDRVILVPPPLSPYRLELFDLTGRRRASHQGVPGRGIWAIPRTLPRGLYLLRLEVQGLILRHKILWVGQD